MKNIILAFLALCSTAFGQYNDVNYKSVTLTTSSGTFKLTSGSLGVTVQSGTNTPQTISTGASIVTGSGSLVNSGTTRITGTNNSVTVQSGTLIVNLANIPAGAITLKGDIDASANPNYPAGAVGDAYSIIVAGKIGGASGVSVDVGDLVVCKTANAGGTQAAVGADWFILDFSSDGFLVATNNLSDVTNSGSAATNIGLGAASNVTFANLIATGSVSFDASDIYSDGSGNLSLGSLLIQGTQSITQTKIFYPQNAFNTLADLSTLYYPGNEGDNKLADDSGNIYYNNGNLLVDNNQNLYYGNNEKLADNNGDIYYNDGTMLADHGQNLYYGNGNLLVDNMLNLYYGNGSILADNAGDIYYSDGTPLADINSNLYVSVTGILLGNGYTSPITAAADGTDYWSPASLPSGSGGFQPYAATLNTLASKTISGTGANIPAISGALIITSTNALTVNSTGTLGTAAFTNSTAYDASGTAAGVLTVSTATFANKIVAITGTLTSGTAAISDSRITAHNTWIVDRGASITNVGALTVSVSGTTATVRSTQILDTSPFDLFITP